MTFTVILILTVVFFIFLQIWEHRNKNKIEYSKMSIVKNEEFYNNFYQLTEFKIKKAEYMLSFAWTEKRLAKLEETDFCCQQCYIPYNLQIHHIRGYDKIPNEPLEDLVVLCDACHKKEHEKHGYPKTYKEYMKWDHPLE